MSIFRRVEGKEIKGLSMDQGVIGPLKPRNVHPWGFRGGGNGQATLFKESSKLSRKGTFFPIHICCVSFLM